MSQRAFATKKSAVYIKICPSTNLSRIVSKKTPMHKSARDKDCVPTAKSPPRTVVESPPKGPTRGSGKPPEGRPKNPGGGKNVLQSPLKGPTRGSENFAQNVGSWGGLC
jgi:hypothetical protein